MMSILLGALLAVGIGGLVVRAAFRNIDLAHREQRH
jgi:hypothetical protein